MRQNAALCGNGLTLSQTIPGFTTLRNGPFENTEGKGENAGNQHFLLFPQYFLPYLKQKFSFNSLPNDKILDLSKLKAFADNNLNVYQKLKFALGKNRKHFGKRRKCWLPAYFPFPTMFSEGFFLRVVKSRDCVVKS